MNILNSSSFFIPLKPSSFLGTPRVHSSVRYTFGYPKTQLALSFPIRYPQTIPNPLCSLSVSARISSNQETVSVIDGEDIMDKDWSFLETNPATEVDHMHNIDRIISAGEITETSKVLVSVGSEGFVDKLICSSPCEELLVVHDSLLVLACIKEKYDKVKCWQGELINVPEKLSPLNVVFLYFLPALPFELDKVLAAIAKLCSPGAKIVISHPQGREMVEKQRLQYPDVVVSKLPEKTALLRIASENSFEVVEFVDEAGFYLAVLKHNVNPGKYFSLAHVTI